MIDLILRILSFSLVIAFLAACNTGTPAVTTTPTEPPALQPTSLPTMTDSPLPVTSTPQIFSPTEEPVALFADSKIVFADNSGVYSMNGDGTNLVQLAQTDWVTSLSLSANGKTTVYPFDLSSMSIFSTDGTSEFKPNVLGRIIDAPVVSPNGKWVAYMANIEDRRHINVQTWDYDIVLSKIDGSSQSVLVQNEFSNEFPVWSPDGTEIAYITNSFLDGELVTSLNIISVKDLQNRKIQEFKLGWVDGMSWSPDGNYLAFTAGLDKNIIYIIKSDGSGLTQLLDVSNDKFDPAWLPDSRHLVFRDRVCKPDCKAVLKVVDTVTDQVVEIEPQAFEILNSNGAYRALWSLPVDNSQVSECTQGWTHLSSGTSAQVTPGSSNRVRSEPKKGDNILTSIPEGTVVKLLEGPVCADGLVFWKVESDKIPGGSGWTAEGDEKDYWLAPYINTSVPTSTKAKVTSTSTPKATNTPKPTATPKPSATFTRTRTPQPTATAKAQASSTPKSSQPPEKSSWKKMPAVSGLPVRGMHAVYDSSGNVIVLFGGANESGGTLDQTWKFDGKTWKKFNPPDSPPVRFWHGMAYDSARNVTVLFGGQKAIAERGGGFLDDTWEYDGTNWVNIDTSHRPLPRGNGALLAYDNCRGKTILFGGEDSRGLSTATWEYDGKDWTQVQTPDNPPGRGLSAMVFDPNRCRLVLFGGMDNGKKLNDTWEYDGTNWEKINTSSSPSGRWAHAMAFDPVTGHIVLFGGWANTELKDTWVYDGTNWKKVTTASSPSARQQHAMAFDGVNGQVLAISGFGSDGNWAFTEGVLKPTPTPTSNPNCALGFTRLKIGDFAQPAGEPSLANRIRSEPKIGNNILTGFTPGMFVKLVDGPVCAEGFVFWKVESRFIPGGVGWTAEGDGIQYFLEPLK